jgi:hypothetical protein
MKYLITIFASLLLFNCNGPVSETKNELALLNKDEIKDANMPDYTYYYDTITHDHYEIKLGVLDLGDDEFELVINMKLLNDSFFVSPNEKQDFKGKFAVFYDDTAHLTFNGEMEEIPNAIGEMDPHVFMDGKVKVVRNQTRYVQKVKRNTADDFNTSANLQFVIEPSCTMEKIPLIVVNQGGYLKFHLRGC